MLGHRVDFGEVVVVPAVGQDGVLLHHHVRRAVHVLLAVQVLGYGKYVKK